jgi:hypothetical protein
MNTHDSLDKLPVGRASLQNAVTPWKPGPFTTVSLGGSATMIGWRHVPHSTNIHS